MTFENKRLISIFILFIMISFPSGLALASSAHHSDSLSFPLELADYHDSEMTSLGEIITHRAKQEPLNLVVSLLFLGAIIHTFLSSRFQKIAHDIQAKYDKAAEQRKNDLRYTGDIIKEVSFKAQMFHFLGEVEVVFGLWVLPVFWSIAYAHGLDASISYFNSVNFTEPMFVVVIMTLAAARPIMRLAEQALKKISLIGKGSPAALWFTILTIGPLMGSFITEPAAMTISALILAKEFYARRPSAKFAYATLGLLFVNISVGGTLTHFAAPPVLMVASKWDWSLGFMFMSYGWKAVIGILIANTLFLFIFKKEFGNLTPLEKSEGSKLLVKWDMREDSVPVVITIIHILFMVWAVLFAHYPSLFIAGFLGFLGFVQSTGHHQNRTNLKPALLVGFFLAGLVIHGGLQKWWIAPILGSLGDVPLMLGATVLTAFNDNAAITYLSSLVPNLSEGMKYAVVAGAVTGGGLTVIANAPNPAGQSILQRFFEQGISPAKLLVAALIPTIIMGLAFMIL